MATAGPTPTSTGSFQHSYTSAGTFSPVCTALDDNGDKATATQTIKVNPAALVLEGEERNRV